jgi:hypothetical protein
MLAAMKLAKLCPLLLIAACSSGPSKEDSMKVFLATNTAMASAQANAVTASRAAAVLPGSLTIAYTGACLFGGTVAVNGNYEGSRTDDKAAFDLTMQFTNCKDALGELDGSLTWTSTANGSTFDAAMTGSISYRDPNTDASCDYDLHLGVAPALVSYSGSVCGYNVETELQIGPRS